MVPLLIRQYRMSLNIVAWHLTLFCSSWEFVSTSADAMEGKTIIICRTLTYN